MTKLIINNIFSPIDIISLEAICPFLKLPYFLVSWFDRDVSTCSTFNCKFQTVHFHTFNIINKATKKNSKQKNHKPTPYLSPTHKLKHLLFFFANCNNFWFSTKNNIVIFIKIGFGTAVEPVSPNKIVYQC